jgi:hypothetical protein
MLTVAMSIFFIFIIASNARFAAARSESVVFCLLPQRPLVGRGTRRDGLTSHLRLKNGRFEPFNPSVDVFQRIGIHR